MALYNLAGRRKRHDVIEVVALFAKYMYMFLLLQYFSKYIRFMVKVLIESN